MNQEDLKLYLGKKIKHYRNKLGLTQEELSEGVGVFQRQISLIELGKSFPRPETLIKMTNIFGCSISDLFDFDFVKNNKEIKMELIKIINNMSEEKLKILYIIGKNI